MLRELVTPTSMNTADSIYWLGIVLLFLWISVMFCLTKGKVGVLITSTVKIRVLPLGVIQILVAILGVIREGSNTRIF